MFLTDATFSKAVLNYYDRIGDYSDSAKIGDCRVLYTPEKSGIDVSIRNEATGKSVNARIISGSLFWTVGVSVALKTHRYLIPDMTLDGADVAPNERIKGRIYNLGDFDFELGDVYLRGNVRDQFNIMITWAYVSLPA